MKRKYLIQTLILFIAAHAIHASAQKKKYNREADKAYEQYQYSIAAELYQKEFDPKNQDYKTVEHLANCYRMMDNSAEAEKWYEKVMIFPEATPDDIFNYAVALQNNGKYLDAKIEYKTYAAKKPDQLIRINRLINACDTAMAWIKHPERYDVKIDPFLNTEYADFSPAYFEKGIIFTTDRKEKVLGIEKPSANNSSTGWTGRPFLKMYYAERDSGKNKWKDISPLPAVVDDKYHNGPGVYSEANHTLYFTRTRYFLEKTKVVNDPTNWVPKDTSSNRLVARLEIYSVQKNGNKWEHLKSFQYNNPGLYSVGHPAISANGKVLYFASDMPGGMGGTDIYYCERMNDTTWSKPVNLGNMINTSGRESFPVIDKSGTLYFSSDRSPGMGGLDIFSASGEKTNWSEVQNIRYPLNSSKDDFGILFDDNSHQSGYLSSNRSGENGTDDIFRFSYIPLPPVVLTGRTFLKTEINNVSEIKKIDSVNVIIYKNDSIAGRFISGPEGGFKTTLQRGKTFTIKGSRPDCFTATTSVKADKDTVYAELVLEKIIINKPIIVKNIYYDLDKWFIRDDAKPELDKIVTMMNDNPTIKIELSSHTDSRASDKYNMILSQKRAAAAVNYIVSKGIPESRITAKGYGETHLLNRCKNGVECTEEEHQVNRRTEFKVTGYTGGAVIYER